MKNTVKEQVFFLNNESAEDLSVIGFQASLQEGDTAC